MPITHSFVSTKSDGNDATLVKPSDWNGAHVGADLTLLEQHSASSSSSLDFTTCITSTYDDYLIEFVNILPASSAALLMRFSTDGGSTYDSTAAHYAWSDFVFSSAGTTFGGSSSDSSIQVYPHSGRTMTSSLPVIGYLKLYSPLSGSFKTKATGQFCGGDSVTSDVTQTTVTSVSYLLTTAVNAVRFIMSTGNITSGTIRVYGIGK